MAAENPFSYTPTPGKLQEFLQKLQSMSAPQKLDQKYLSSVGFGSSNSRPFIPILKKVGLLDASGAPTDAYTKGLRGGEQGKALVAAGIRAGYDPLFQVFSDANLRSTAELTTFVRSNSNLDDQKVALAVATFQTLCKFGDFGPAVHHSSNEMVDTHSSKDRGAERRASGGGGEQSSSVTINVNIALSVDATSDPAVYDAFFAAMAKHIKVLDGGP